jgi:metal-sulfur cluster biosynthetic enzyme
MATDIDIREALRHVTDPELGVNIVDLGLVYGIEVDGPRALVTMTMTSPACPMADLLKELIESAIAERVPDVSEVRVIVEWDPPWDPDMMSDEARRQLDGGDAR